MMREILGLVLAVMMFSPVFAQRNIGPVDVTAEKNIIPVRVSANTPELNRLAIQAFGSHGRYRVTQTGYAYAITFNASGATQVLLNITKGSAGTAFYSQTITGENAREALLRAADVAVERTNGIGLKGFFASRIAFIGERTGIQEVYTGDLFFGQVRQITHDRAHAMTPRWSPKGTRLLYTTFFKTGFPDLYELDLENKTQKAFMTFKGTNSGARFSPAGDKVAMILSGIGNPEVYVSNAEGRRVNRLTHTDAAEASPCFSPDGSQIVFTSDAAGGPQLYVVSVAGGTMQRLPTKISGFCAEPDWSTAAPNKIAFTTKIGSSYQIAVYDLNARSSVQVSHASFDGIEPCWLADGRHLLYTARDRSTSRIYILDTETGKSVPMSPADLGVVKQASVFKP